MKFTIGLTLALVASVLLARARGSQPATIAYVSPQRISTGSAAARAAVGQVQALQRERTAEVRAKQQALIATQRQVADTPDPAARAKLLQQEDQQRAELERLAAQSQSDIQALQVKVNTELLQRVKAILDDLLKGHDVQVVLNSDTAVIWAPPSSDLTAAVIARLNAPPPVPTPKN